MDEQEFKNLTVSALDILKNLATQEWDNAKDTFSEIANSISKMAQVAELNDEEIDIINFGSRSKPNLVIITDDGVELGVIDVSPEGYVTSNVHNNIKAAKEVNEEIKENLDKFSQGAKDEELRSKVKDLIKQFTTPSSVEDVNREVSQQDLLTNAFANINKSLEESGIDWAETKKIQGKIMNTVDNLASPMLPRKDILNQLKDVKKEIEGLYDKLKQETAIAKVNGYDGKAAEQINNIGDRIKDATIRACELQASLPTIKQEIGRHFKEASLAVSHGLNKVKAALDKKIQAGKTTLDKMGKTVHEANEKFFSQRDTAYTNLTEKIQQLNRNYMSLSFSIDRSISQNLDKVKDTLEKSYNRGAEIKGALKDLGRAIAGKDRTGEKAELNNAQKAILQTLQSKSQEYKDEMASLKDNYKASQQISLANIKGAQELRKSVGLDFSKSLNERIKDISSREIGEKKAPAKEKSAPSKDDGMARS
jgi:hypothetical protein